HERAPNDAGKPTKHVGRGIEDAEVFAVVSRLYPSIRCASAVTSLFVRHRFGPARVCVSRLPARDLRRKFARTGPVAHILRQVRRRPETSQLNASAGCLATELCGNSVLLSLIYRNHQALDACIALSNGGWLRGNSQTTPGTSSMKRSEQRILTTHVGSLIRPKTLLDAGKDAAHGPAYQQHVN